MHGVNWAAAKDKYETMLPHIADTEELHNVILEMIGDLNASAHRHLRRQRACPASRPQERIQTRYPGFELQPDASGFYKVGYIYRKGPADHDYIKIAPGNFILAVNGKDLKTSDNYWKLFNIVSRPQIRVPGELQSLRRRRLDRDHRTPHRRRHDRPPVRPLGGRAQGHGRQA